MTKKAETFTRYDTADYLETEDDIAAYLSACAEEDDPALFLAALGDVARARNVTQLAAQTGLTRMGLYKALSGTGNPSFATVSKVAHALGLKITAVSYTHLDVYKRQVHSSRCRFAARPNSSVRLGKKQFSLLGWLFTPSEPIAMR